MFSALGELSVTEKMSHGHKIIQWDKVTVINLKMNELVDIIRAIVVALQITDALMKSFIWGHP